MPRTPAITLSGLLPLDDDKSALPVDMVVLGESLDDGLGELPHYAQWKDPTGRDPLGRASGRVLTAVR